MNTMTSSCILAFVLFFISLNPIFSSRDRQWDIVGGRRLTSSGSGDDDGDLVTNLPGQPHVDFKHYAGYITVNQNNGRALFYWFFEAITNPQHKPLVLWLNGGPGCSSVGYGATQEIGPFFVNGNALKLNNFSWNQEANLLFLESPVGVGFSYSNTTTEYKNLGDDFTANDSYIFLQNWFLKYPSYRTQEFYIAGESYAGHYVPELAQLIVDRNKDLSLHINLKGILLGNPEMSDAEDLLGMVDYAWSHAVISYETHNKIRTSCDFNSSNPRSNQDCNEGVQEMWKQYNQIDIHGIYTPGCSSPTIHYSKSMHMLMNQYYEENVIIADIDPCLNGYAHTFYNNIDVQKALHVSDGPNPKSWSICNDEIFNSWAQSKRSLIPIYNMLISAGLRVWLYSGDDDGRVPMLSTEYSINTLGLPITKTWRPWFNEHEVSGWYEEYKGLTFVTFRGAGHDVPTFKPSNSLVLFSSFLKGQSLPSTR